MRKKTILPLIICLFALEIVAQTPPLEVAAYTFSISPKVGTPSGHSRTGNRIEEVFGNLKSTLFLFRQGDKQLCLLTSPLGVERDILHQVSVEELSVILGLPKEAIITNSSHNHTIPFTDVSDREQPVKGSPDYLSWELGREYLSGLRRAAKQLAENLQPVEVVWGKAEENRITYNRKGEYLDGSTYFMREEDRLTLKGEGYHGLIDPEAVVVLFNDLEGNPITGLSFFTGHPVAGYNPEKLISFGQFPQTANEILSQYLGGIPIGFVQGAAGNINSKHMLSGTIEQARELGELLGDAFILASQSTLPSKRVGFEWSREYVDIPLSKLPKKQDIKEDLAAIDDFIRRGNAGDENTYKCVGMNFPKALSPPYRAKLVELVRPWYVWALDQYQTNNLRNIPEYLTVEIVVARFGDVGFVGMPFEAYVETGLKIKAGSNLPCVLTCGYTDGRYGYIPDASGVDDREYMSGFFRYLGDFIQLKDEKDKDIPKRTYSAAQYIPPYKSPGADACAEVAIKKINEFAF